MNIERNKIDFEDALANMKESLELLDHCVGDCIMNTLRDVVTEYEMHFIDDIQEMMELNEELKDKLEEVENGI